MNTVITNPSAGFLEQKVAGCVTSLKIICPFVKSAALGRVLVARNLPPDACHLICRAEDRSVIDGALDYQALLTWVGLGCKLRVARRTLHAKAFLFDDCRALVTSANLTSGGIGPNQEIGLFTDDPVSVSDLAKLFDALWQSLGPDITAADVLRWQEHLRKITARSKPSRVIPGLRDHGRKTNDKARLQSAKARNASATNSGPAYYLKMYATSKDRDPVQRRMADSPSHWGGLTFSHHGPFRPTRMKAGDIFFVCWLVAGGRKMIGMRGEVERAWDPARDVAPAAMRQRHKEVDKWPDVVWLSNVDVLRGPIGSLIDLDKVVAALGADTFEQSCGDPKGPAAARDVLRYQRSHPRLTPAGAEHLERLFTRMVRRKGSVCIPIGQTTWWERFAPGGFTKK